MIVALAGVEVEDDSQTRTALGFHAGGMDLGDAFVLASAPAGSTVATFDRKLVKRAKKAPGAPAVKHPTDCG